MMSRFMSIFVGFSLALSSTAWAAEGSGVFRVSDDPLYITAALGAGSGVGDAERADDLLDFEETGATFLGTEFAIAASNVGYIDSALIGTYARIRFDAAYSFNNADRAEFFYSTWTDFGGQTPVNTIGPNDNVDSQTFWFYYEHQLSRRLSAFIDVPFLFNNPSGNPGPGPNASGIGDLVAGIKYRVWENCNQTLTFQLKNYIPTGDTNKWLTAGHSSIEPGLLYYNRINDCWTLEAELRDWIPIDGASSNRGPYAGNVLRYGVGLSYNALDTGNWHISPVVEFVGWSVLEGQKFTFNPDNQVDADGDTIVNAKVGLRIGRCGGRGSMYVGYGHALTDEIWYRDIIRADYRIAF